jgi:hypothetical protein
MDHHAAPSTAHTVDHAGVSEQFFRHWHHPHHHHPHIPHLHFPKPAFLPHIHLPPVPHLHLPHDHNPHIHIPFKETFNNWKNIITSFDPRKILDLVNMLKELMSMEELEPAWQQFVELAKCLDAEALEKELTELIAAHPERFGNLTTTKPTYTTPAKHPLRLGGPAPVNGTHATTVAAAHSKTGAAVAPRGHTSMALVRPQGFDANAFVQDVIQTIVKPMFKSVQSVGAAFGGLLEKTLDDLNRVFHQTMGALGQLLRAQSDAEAGAAVDAFPDDMWSLLFKGSEDAILKIADICTVVSQDADDAFGKLTGRMCACLAMQTHSFIISSGGLERALSGVRLIIKDAIVAGARAYRQMVQKAKMLTDKLIFEPLQKAIDASLDALLGEDVLMFIDTVVPAAVEDACQDTRKGIMTIGFDAAYHGRSPCEYKTYLHFSRSFLLAPANGQADSPLDQKGRDTFSVPALLKRGVRGVIPHIVLAMKEFVQKHVVAPFSKQLDSLTAWFHDAVENTIDGACGLIPEVGGLIETLAVGTPAQILTTELMAGKFSLILSADLIPDAVYDALGDLLETLADMTIDTFWTLLQKSGVLSLVETTWEKATGIGSGFEGLIKKAGPVLDVLAKITWPILSKLMGKRMEPLLASVEKCDAGFDAAYEQLKCQIQCEDASVTACKGNSELTDAEHLAHATALTVASIGPKHHELHEERVTAFYKKVDTIHRAYPMRLAAQASFMQAQQTKTKEELRKKRTEAATAVAVRHINTAHRQALSTVVALQPQGSAAAVHAATVHEQLMSLPKLQKLAKVLMGMIDNVESALNLMRDMTSCMAGKSQAHVAALNTFVGAHHATREGRIVSEQDVNPSAFIGLIFDDVVDPMMKGFKYSGAKLAPMIQAANTKINQLFTDPDAKKALKQLLANTDFSSAEGIVNSLPPVIWDTIFDESIEIFDFFGTTCNDMMLNAGYNAYHTRNDVNDAKIFKFLGKGCQCTVETFLGFMKLNKNVIIEMAKESFAKGATMMTDTVQRLNFVEHAVQKTADFVSESIMDVLKGPQIRAMEAEAERGVQRLCTNTEIAVLIVGYQAAERGVSPCDYPTFSAFTSQPKAANSILGLATLAKSEARRLMQPAKDSIRAFVDTHVVNPLKGRIDPLLLELNIELELVIEGLLGLIPEFGGLAGLPLITVPMNTILTPFLSGEASDFLIGGMADSAIDALMLFMDSAVNTTIDTVAFHVNGAVQDVKNEITTTFDDLKTDAYNKLVKAVPIVSVLAPMAWPVIKKVLEIAFSKLKQAWSICEASLEVAYQDVKCRLANFGMKACESPKCRPPPRRGASQTPVPKAEYRPRYQPATPAVTTSVAATPPACDFYEFGFEGAATAAVAANKSVAAKAVRAPAEDPYEVGTAVTALSTDTLDLVTVQISSLFKGTETWAVGPNDEKAQQLTTATKVLGGWAFGTIESLAGESTRSSAHGVASFTSSDGAHSFDMPFWAATKVDDQSMCRGEAYSTFTASASKAQLGLASPEFTAFWTGISGAADPTFNLTATRVCFDDGEEGASENYLYSVWWKQPKGSFSLKKVPAVAKLLGLPLPSASASEESGDAAAAVSMSEFEGFLGASLFDLPTNYILATGYSPQDAGDSLHKLSFPPGFHAYTDLPTLYEGVAHRNEDKAGNGLYIYAERPIAEGDLKDSYSRLFSCLLYHWTKPSGVCDPTVFAAVYLPFHSGSGHHLAITSNINDNGVASYADPGLLRGATETRVRFEDFLTFPTNATASVDLIDLKLSRPQMGFSGGKFVLEQLTSTGMDFTYEATALVDLTGASASDFATKMTLLAAVAKEESPDRLTEPDKPIPADHLGLGVKTLPPAVAIHTSNLAGASDAQKWELSSQYTALGVIEGKEVFVGLQIPPYCVSESAFCAEPSDPSFQLGGLISSERLSGTELIALMLSMASDGMFKAGAEMSLGALGATTPSQNYKTSELPEFLKGMNFEDIQLCYSSGDAVTLSPVKNAKPSVVSAVDMNFYIPNDVEASLLGGYSPDPVQSARCGSDGNGWLALGNTMVSGVKFEYEAELTTAHGLKLKLMSVGSDKLSKDFAEATTTLVVEEIGKGWSKLEKEVNALKGSLGEVKVAIEYKIPLKDLYFPPPTKPNVKLMIESVGAAEVQAAEAKGATATGSKEKANAKTGKAKTGKAKTGKAATKAVSTQADDDADDGMEDGMGLDDIEKDEAPPEQEESLPAFETNKWGETVFPAGDLDESKSINVDKVEGEEGGDAMPQNLIAEGVLNPPVESDDEKNKYLGTLAKDFQSVYGSGAKGDTFNSPPFAAGEECLDDVQCSSNNCQDNYICAASADTTTHQVHMAGFTAPSRPAGAATKPVAEGMVTAQHQQTKTEGKFVKDMLKDCHHFSKLVLAGDFSEAECNGPTVRDHEGNTLLHAYDNFNMTFICPKFEPAVAEADAAVGCSAYGAALDKACNEFQACEDEGGRRKDSLLAFKY